MLNTDNYSFNILLNAGPEEEKETSFSSSKTSFFSSSFHSQLSTEEEEDEAEEDKKILNLKEVNDINKYLFHTCLDNKVAPGKCYKERTDLYKNTIKNLSKYATEPKYEETRHNLFEEIDKTKFSISEVCERKEIKNSGLYDKCKETEKSNQEALLRIYDLSKRDVKSF